MNDPRITSVLELLDPPKGFEPWHGGPTMIDCLHNVDAAMAAWKPTPERHSIWEFALHIAYWKHRVRQFINPETEKEFDCAPAEWPVIKNPTGKQWNEDQSLIKKEHENLIRDIRAFSEGRLNDPVKEREEWTYRQLLDGIAAHDTYHIAQIQLMKRLYEELK